MHQPNFHSGDLRLFSAHTGLVRLKHKIRIIILIQVSFGKITASELTCVPRNDWHYFQANKYMHSHRQNHNFKFDQLERDWLHGTLRYNKYHAAVKA